MNAPLKHFLYLINALIFLGGAGFGVVAAIDELSDPTPAVANGDDAAQARPPAYPGSGRVFVLFIDSLRDKTAESPELMPNLVRLAKSSTHAAVETVYDAVTAPAIRAAFTGRSHFRVLGFVQNFVKHSQSLPSVFGQLAAAGGHTTVFSDNKTFSQFGGDIADDLPFEAEGATTSERQNAQARAALELFQSGKRRLVIFHVGYVDYVAHKFGIAHADYRRDVRGVDALIGELASGVSLEDTFVVLGDHGHTETGRHALGLDVPTYFLARGPGFRPGTALGKIHITSYRYLLSWALKLPLVTDYTRDRHPEALAVASGEELPPSYAIAATAPARPADTSSAVSRTGPLPIFAGLAMLVGLAFGCWWILGSIIHDESTQRFPWKRIGKILGLSALGAIPFLGVGIALASLRSWVHEPFFPTIYQIWGGVLLVMLFLVRKIDLGALALVVLGVPFVLLWPTTYRYGSTAVFGPAWFCWASCAFFLSRGFRDGLPTAKYLVIGKWRVRKALVLFLGIVYLVQPFFFTDASNFDFTEFKALVPEIAPTSLWAQTLVGIFATFVIFFRKEEGVANWLLTSVFVSYFVAIFLHVIPEGARGEFFLGVALLALAGIVHRKVRLGAFHAEAEGMARTLFLASLMVFYFYFVRVASETRLHAMMLFAALRLSILMLDHLPTARRNLRLNALFLTIIGFIVAGWVTLSWGLQRMEWHAAYDFFPPKLVEEYVALFLPFIILKYSLPVLIARFLITERVKVERGFPAQEAALFFGFKFATLILITLGLGYYTAGSNVYLEATAELAIFMSLAGGLL